jgi:hypothetical protein
LSSVSVPGSAVVAPLAEAVAANVTRAIGSVASLLAPMAPEAMVGFG